jgi:uncharacterized damage-inducible protein DinB
MQKSLPALALCVIASCTFAIAQQAPLPSASTPAANDNPYSTFAKIAYSRVSSLLLRSAEKMPEENYSFKPVDGVRTYGQILGHAADAQYLFCSIATGEKNPGVKIEESKTSKADLTAALKDAFTYCDKAYASMTDASGAQMVSLFGHDTPKLGVLTVNNMHNMEHYGNLVVYMRMKGIVPPSSEQSSTPPPKK